MLLFLYHGFFFEVFSEVLIADITKESLMRGTKDDVKELQNDLIRLRCWSND